VPFPERESSSKMWAHLNEAPPGAGTRLDAVIQRAMAKEPADRYPSAGDLGRAAVAATHGEAVTEPEHAVGTGEAALAETVPLAVTAPTERQPRRAKKGSRRKGRLRRWLIPLLTLLVAAALTFTALVVVPRLNDSNSSPSEPSGIPVPSLVGQTLDVAENRLDDLGLRYQEVGGGLFGVIFASDWEVCETSPPADSRVKPGATVKLFIDEPGKC
jgi:hypothetical protein